MNSDFKFAIGDMVQVIPAPTHYGQVVERLAQECPGGVQRYYTIRMCTQTISKPWGDASVQMDSALWKFNEIELEAKPAEEAEPKTVLYYLQAAKELALQDLDHDLAASIRGVVDRAKKAARE